MIKSSCLTVIFVSSFLLASALSQMALAQDDPFVQSLVKLKQETGRDNALIYYARVASLFSKDPTILNASKVAEQVLNGKGSAGAPELIAAYKTAAPAFAEIKKGAEINNAERPQLQGFHDPMANLLAFQNMAKLMCSAGLFRIQQNNVPAGFENLLAVQKMGHHLTCANASMLESVMGIKIETMAADAILKVLPTGKADSATLKLIARHIEHGFASTADPAAPFYAQATVMKNFQEQVLKAKQGDVAAQQYLQTLGMKPEDLELMKANVELLQTHTKEEFDLINAMAHLPHHQRNFQEFDVKIKALTDNLPASARSAIQPPNYHEYFVRLEAMHAKLQKAAVEAAVLAYKSEKGSLPQNVQALVPEYLSAVSVDPFTGQSITISVTGATYQLLPETMGKSAEERK